MYQRMNGYYGGAPGAGVQEAGEKLVREASDILVSTYGDTLAKEPQ